jgi:hypothetical protein
MATLDIGGRKVTVDDSFLSLPADQQNATVEEIAGTLGPAAGAETAVSRAITGVPGEIYNAGKAALTSINDNLNPFSDARRASIERQGKMGLGEGLVEGLKQTAGVGAGLAAIPEFPFSLVTGTARSLGGHPMAAAERAIGSVINPEAAAQRTHEAAYEDWKGGIDKALMGAGARGVGMVPQAPVTRTVTTPTGATTVTVQPKPVLGMEPQKAPLPSAQDLQTAARSAYQSPEVTGLRIDPQSTNALAAGIEHDLLKKGFRPTGSSAQDTFKILREEVGASPRAGYIEVADLDNARSALQKTAKQRDAFGQPTSESAAAQQAVRAIDDYLVNVKASDVLAGDAAAAQAKLAEARGNYAAYKRSSEIDYRLSKAERQAKRSGAGMNLENARRQKIDQVSDYGLTAQEKALKAKIVEGTGPRNALRTVGKLGVDGGLSLLLNAGAAAQTGGMSIPVTIAGTLARLAGQRLTKAQIKQLNEMIRARSPLAQSTPAQMMPPPGGLLGAIPALQLGQAGGGLLGSLGELPSAVRR